MTVSGSVWKSCSPSMSGPSAQRTEDHSGDQDRNIGFRDNRVWNTDEQSDKYPGQCRMRRQLHICCEESNGESAKERTSQGSGLVRKFHRQHEQDINDA